MPSSKGFNNCLQRSLPLSPTLLKRIHAKRSFSLCSRGCKRGESRFKSGKLSLLRLIRRLSLWLKKSMAFGEVQCNGENLCSEAGYPRKPNWKQFGNLLELPITTRMHTTLWSPTWPLKRAIIHKSICLQLRELSRTWSSRGPDRRGTGRTDHRTGCPSRTGRRTGRRTGFRTGRRSNE